jgi:hypothetical protein
MSWLEDGDEAVVVDKDGKRRRIRVLAAQLGVTEAELTPMFKSRAGGNNMISNEELLRKAVLESGSDLTQTLADFDTKGALSVSQAKRFIQLMAAEQRVLPEVTTVTNMSAKFQTNVIESGGRLLRPGIESTVGATATPTVTAIEMSTGFFKCVLPVSDEWLEDVAGANAKEAVAAAIADQVGLDVEDYMLNSSDSDTEASMHDTDAVYALLPDGGWVWQTDNGNSRGSGPGFYDAQGDSQDYQVVFRQLLTSIPARFRRNLGTGFRFYVSDLIEIKYRDALSARGTQLGDISLQGENELRYQSVVIRSVPVMHINTATTPDSTHILLADKANLMAGFQRAINIEFWRDPREGFASWVVTTRFDAKVANLDATACAENVDVDA